MRAFTTTMIVLTALGAAGTAIAAEPTEPTAPRYTITPSQGGFIRMDTSSGVLSFCSTNATPPACKILADDKIAMQTRMDKLQKTNKDLKEENRRLEDMLLGDNKQDGKPGGILPPGTFKLPTEKDIDKALKYVEQMYQKFRDKLRDLEKQRDGGSNPTPL